MSDDKEPEGPPSGEGPPKKPVAETSDPLIAHGSQPIDPIEVLEAEQRELMVYLGRGLTAIVHDMRAPILVVMHNLEYLRDAIAAEYAIEALDLEALDDAYTAALLLSDMAQAIGDVSATRAFEPESVSTSELIETATRLCSPQLSPNVTLLIEIEHECQVRVSRGRMIHALINLIVNGNQAIAESGTVTVRASRRVESATISVIDDGAGIDPAIAGRIFDPLFTTKPIRKGSGIGLSNAREAVESHGGTIEVESTLGSGARFTIVLPQWAG